MQASPLSFLHPRCTPIPLRTAIISLTGWHSLGNPDADAEPMSGRSLHHHPLLQAIHDVRPHFLKTRYLGRDIVRLDVQVDATLVIDVPKLHNRLVWWCLQHPVVARLPQWLGSSV